MRKLKTSVSVELPVTLEKRQPNTPFTEEEFVVFCDVNGNKRLHGSGSSETAALENLKTKFKEWAKEHLFW